MPTPRQKRGFTLIELLCVIAIIGVLATVIVASLASARQKAIDASVKQSLSGARSQAEIFYSGNGAAFYSGVCSTATASGAKSISDIVTSAAKAAGFTTVNTAIGTGGSSGVATCHDTTAGWAAEVPLKLGGFFCADSTQFASTTLVSTLGANDVTCGP